LVAVAAVLFTAAGVLGMATNATAVAVKVSTQTLLGQLVVAAEHPSGYVRAKFRT
jgi:hypothetical protein